MLPAAVPGITGQMQLMGPWLYVADPGNNRVVRIWAQLDDSLWNVSDALNVRPREQWREQY